MESEFGLPNGDPGGGSAPTPGGATQPVGSREDLRPSRRRRARLGLSVAIVVVIGIAVAVVAIPGGPSIPGAGIAPADFVVSATQTTLTQSTADLVFGGSVSTSGHSIPITGSGAAILSSPQQFAATFSFSLPGSTFQEKEVLTDGHLYMGIDSDGHDVSDLIPGKHWVEIPIPVGTSSSLGTGTSDPLAQLRMLVAKGNTVTRLGTKTIDGVTASGYAVTITRQNLLHAEQQYLSSSNFDPATQQQLSQAAQSLPPPSIDVWFDSSKLLRRMGFVINQTQDGHSIASDVQMDFVNYGAPVSITTPSPGDVVSLNQFLAAAKAVSGSGG